MINGCSWLVLGVLLIAAAVWLGVLPLWLLSLLASPIALLIGHWFGFRRASHVIEAAGHKKAAADGENLRRGWKVF